MELLFVILIIFCLVLVSGFFSMSETGLTGASRARLAKLEKDGNKKAAITNKLRKNKDSLIGAILLGNNLFNILASSIATAFAIKYYGDEAIAVTTVIMTLLILIFGEVMPKTFAFYNAEKIALAVAPVWNILVKVFYPVTRLIQAVSDFLLKVLGLNKKQSENEGKEALRGAIELHHSEGEMEKADRDMLDSILDLNDVDVNEVMIHRKDIESLDINLSPKTIIAKAVKTAHSRIPMWQDKPENIIGILHTKTLLQLNDNKNITNEDIKALLFEPVFVIENTNLTKQLNHFRQERLHMAIVVDEYGSVMGLVTLEDILEEIVGEIDDETDNTKQDISYEKDGSILVRGDYSIRDINRELDWDLEEDKAATIAGYILENLEALPEIGDVFNIEDKQYTIVRKVGNQIKNVRIKEIS